MDMQRIEFSVDGVEYAVERPDTDVLAEADQVHQTTLKQAVSAGAPCGRLIPDLLKERGLWQEAKYCKLNRLVKEVVADRQTLSQGRLAKASATKLARRVRGKCWQIRELMTDWRAVEKETAEKQAEMAQADFVLTRCFTFAASGQPVFDGIEDYRQHANEPFAHQAAVTLARMLGSEDNIEDIILHR